MLEEVLNKIEGVILVEGKRDKIALQKYTNCKIIAIANKNDDEILEILENESKIYMLFDLDKGGEKLRNRIKFLSGGKVKDLSFILKVIKKTHVEDLM